MLRRATGALAVAVAACGSGSTVIAPPPPPPPATFRIALSADAEDVASAQTLGWSAGIPNAQVTLTPVAGGTAFSATSTAAGIADFGTVTSGSYYVDASRWLSTTEAAALPAALGVDGWAIRKGISVSVGGGVQGISVPTSRRRSLVISEWAFNAGWDPIAGNDYQQGGYLKLYNNADTTIYLDGIVIGEGFGLSYNYSTFPCTLYTQIALDPAGLWNRFAEAFPGTGQEHPLLPGHTVVIATDAIDHRPFFANSLDLSHVDYEFVGAADVDNPSVPNMVQTGTLPSSFSGILFEGLTAVPFLSLPASVAGLPHMTNPSGSGVWARFPASKILDVVAIAPNYGAHPFPECPLIIQPNFDREPSRVRRDDNNSTNEEYQYGVQRKLTPLLSGGRKILQHTRSGYSDFIRAPRAPTAVP
jgi:hypothetical protein